MWQEIRSEFVSAMTSRFIWFITGLADSLYSIGWIALQFLTDWAFRHFPLEGISQIFSLIFQVLFGITTLLPILIFIQKDVRIMWKRSEQEIAEVKKGKRVPFRELVKKE